MFNVIRKIQMKIAMNCHCIPIILAKNKSKINKSPVPSASEHEELLDSYTLIIGTKYYTATFENSCLK